MALRRPSKCANDFKNSYVVIQFCCFSDVDYVITWRAMERLVDLGLVRSIGVSNFNSEQITRILAAAEINPVTNQIECSPSLNQKDLIKFCKNRKIIVTAYSPLGSSNAVTRTPAYLFDDKLQEVASKHNKTPAQIILRYLVRQRTVALSAIYQRIKNVSFLVFRLNWVSYRFRSL